MKEKVFHVSRWCSPAVAIRAAGFLNKKKMDIEIRNNQSAVITLRINPDNYHLRTEFLEQGFEDTPGNWWAYKTPFVYDTNARRWEIDYRIGEAWIPHLTRAERKRCAELIDGYENKLPF